MKTLPYYLTVLSILLFLKTTNAQINLEHTFDEIVFTHSKIYYEPTLYDSNLYYNTVLKDNKYTVTSYNPDYSINSKITYNFRAKTGYDITNVFISKKLFNNNDDYEFLVKYTRKDFVSSNLRDNVILYNKNGGIIKDFGFAYFITSSTSLNIIDNAYRFIVSKNFTDSIPNYQTEIYSVDGIPTGGKVLTYEKQPPYPNPANSTITLPYQLKKGEISYMNIYDISGKLIDTKQIDSYFDKIQLNISNYTRGIYIYEVNGISSKFIVD